MSKSAAESKRIRRANKRKAGYVEKNIWVLPKSWPKIQKLIKLETLRIVKGLERPK